MTAPSAGPGTHPASQEERFDVEIDSSAGPEEFRSQVRAWIGRHATDELTSMTDWSRLLTGNWWSYPDEMATEAYAAWDRAMQEERLVCAGWPTRYGGRELPVDYDVIVDEECLRANVPRVFRDQGEAWVGPAILAHGTDEQKDHYLPRIVAGLDSYCQGFSEPDHGSDLAALETKGVVQGDSLIVNGQKIWTTFAQYASKIFILCRTDPDRSLRHRGITFVIADIAEAGAALEFRPIRQLTGESDFCETFITDLEVPLANVIGGLGNGWAVAMTTLENERGGRSAAARNSAFEKEYQELLGLANASGRVADPDIRRQFLELYADLEALKWWSSSANTVHGSVEKIVSSEWGQRFGHLAMAVVGEEASVRPEGVGSEWEGGEYRLSKWQRAYFGSLASTIASGTTEIQKNVIAEQALAFPREPRGNQG